MSGIRRTRRGRSKSVKEPPPKNRLLELRKRVARLQKYDVDFDAPIIDVANIVRHIVVDCPYCGSHRGVIEALSDREVVEKCFACHRFLGWIELDGQACGRLAKVRAKLRRKSGERRLF